MKKVYGTVEDASTHEYELLDKYCDSQAYENVPGCISESLQVTKSEEKQATTYDYTKCPAYVPISQGHGNQQAMITFKQASATSLVEGEDLDEITAGDDKDYDDTVYY